MAKSHSPRKPHKRREVSLIGGLAAIDRRNRLDMLQSGLDDEQLADLVIAYRLALECMLNGHATEDYWAVLTGSLNMGLTLAEAGIMPESKPLIESALSGCWRAKKRAEGCGKWGLDGDAISAIKAAFWAHDEQVKMARTVDLINAIRAVKDKVDRGVTFQEREAE